MSTKQTNSTIEEANAPLLCARDIRKYFSTETGIFERLFGDTNYVKAVDGVNLTVDAEETVGVVGESGCGKTTLGRTLARLYDPTEGIIEFGGRDITDLEGTELKQLRKDVQVIFQDPLSSLNPRKTVGEIVGRPLEVYDLASGREKRKRVAELFEEVGLQESHTERYPHEFSGGQRQRVGIARALAVEPKLIIADEPVSALDVSVQAQIINLLKRLQQGYGLSYVFIAHDLSVVKHISDRVAVMYLGKVVEKGPTDSIFQYPQHPYTRALLNSIPSVNNKGKMRKALLEGNPPSPRDPPTGCPFHTRCPEFLGDECEADEPALKSVEDSFGALGVDEAIDGHGVACHWLEQSLEVRRAQDPYSNE